MEFIKKAHWWRSSTSNKAHRSKKEMQSVSLFENFITEGNEKADEVAKEGAMLDGRRYGTGKSEHGLTGKRITFMQYVACFHCLVGKNGKIVKRSDPSQKRSGSP